MSSHWSANLEALAARFPVLAERIRTLEPVQPQLKADATGAWELYAGDKRLYEDDPAKVSEAAINQARSAYPKLVIFYGLGLGYQLPLYYAERAQESKHILIIEKRMECLAYALRLHDYTRILKDERVELLVGLDEQELAYELFDYIKFPERLTYIRTLVPICDKAALRLDGAYYIKATEFLQQATYDANRVVFASEEDAYRGFLNILNNLKQSYGVPSFDAFKDLFSGCTGVVVATGPSLPKNFAWLKAAQQRAVIVCTDSALRMLLAQGIRPHFVVCIERVPETKLFFEGLPALPDIPLIANPVVWPETYESYPGPKINMMRCMNQIKWFYPEQETHYLGSSSAHMAYIVLQYLGCSSILLAGQDLAFDRYSERTHAAGIPKLIDSAYQKYKQATLAAIKDGKQEFMVEGNDGTPIMTMDWFNDFKDVLTSLIRYYNLPTYNVIPENYGAKIPYAVRCDPEAAPSLLGAEQPIRELVSEKIKAQSFPSYDDFIAEKYQHAEDALKELACYEKSALQVLDALSVFRQRYSPNYYDNDIFNPFLTRIESITTMLFRDRFYEDFFLSQIVNKTFALSQYSQELLAQDMPFAQRIESQVECIREWYRVTHYWSSRMHHHLENWLEQERATQGVEETAQGAACPNTMPLI